MKLISDKQNPHLNKILVAAKYNGVDLEVPEFNAEDAKKNNPTGRVPLLETPEGTIAGAYTVARYVAKLGKNRLYGSSVFDTASVEQWVDFAASELDTPAAVWVFPILGLIPNNANATQKAKGDVRKALENLNKHLQTRTFLVGQRVTLADIVVALSVQKLYELVLDAPFRKGFVNTNRWFLTVVNQPEVKAVVGEVTLCDKMQVAKEAPKAVKKEAPKAVKKAVKKPTVVKAKSLLRHTLSVGLKRGHPVTPLKRPAKLTSKGKGKRTKFVRDVIREVAGFAPYERRIMELLRNNLDKRALKLAKRKLGTHQRGKKKREELQVAVQKIRAGHF